jgi:hypothetical protein
MTATVTHIVLACDESGAKGRAGRSEASPGEIGVFAGLMVPADLLRTAAPTFNAIALRYAPDDGKLHIADLSPERQQALRADIYALIRKNKIPCFYEAIHVAGFHRFQKEREKLISQGYASRRSAIKMGQPRTN